ncbi:hypothetical protein KAJ41_00320 [Candidatus Parcubacteria bacterium]|nr:hypothetical protein [Candidatus Parcubacteria bacterium]
MNINQEFYDYIKPVLVELRKKIGNNFVVFGSAPLYLLGVVKFNGKINDLDVFSSDISIIPDEAKEVIFHGNQNQKLYKVVIDNMEVDIGFAWPGYGNIFEKIYKNPVVIDDFKFANLDAVTKWKKMMVEKYNRQKDQDYLQKIEEYLNEQ